MDATLRQMRSFVTAARIGSFTKAADILHIAQPTLTVQIRRLEESIGHKLFDRSRRIVRLTRIGEEILPAIERTLHELDLVLSDMSDSSSARHGIIRIASLPSFAAGILPSLINRFRQHHPGALFSLRDVIASQLLDLIRREEVDIGMTAGDVEFSDIDVLFKGQDTMHVVFPKEHPLNRRKRISASSVAEFPLILMHRGTSVRAITDAAFGKAGIIPRPISEPTYMMTAIGMVRAGIGIAVLPSSAPEMYSEPALGHRRIDDAGFARPISLIKKKGRSLPPLCKAFLNEVIVSKELTLAFGRQTGRHNR